MMCKAKSKRHGGPCGAKAVRGKEVCYHHGGRTPSGVAHPRFKHGRYSTVLSKIGLAELFESAYADPELGSLRSQIALAETRMAELLDRLTGESKSHYWSAAARAMADFRAATFEKKAAALAQLEAIIEAGAKDEGTWAQLLAVMEQRRKLTETEGKNLERLHQTMTAEQAMALMVTVIDVVRRHVSDRTVLSEISRELRAVSVGGPRGITHAEHAA